MVFWHKGPVKPIGQVQVKYKPTLVQIALFKHGFGIQGSKKISQFVPVALGGHIHL